MVQDLVTRATSIGKSLPLSVVMGDGPCANLPGDLTRPRFQRRTPGARGSFCRR